MGELSVPSMATDTLACGVARSSRFTRDGSGLAREEDDI